MPGKSAFIASLVVAAVIGGSAYWVLSGDETAAPMPAHDALIQDKNGNTIAHEWQWKNFTNTESAPNAGEDSQADNARPSDEVPANVVGIYRILQSMKLDEGGRVVPDQTVKQALEEGFEDLGPNLSAAAMAELQSVIRVGLPGQAGEEAARMLENYYRFRLAE